MVLESGSFADATTHPGKNHSPHVGVLVLLQQPLRVFQCVAAEGADWFLGHHHFDGGPGPGALRGQLRNEVLGIQNPHALKWIKHQQVLVAGDDVLRPPNDGQLEELVVCWIAAGFQHT